MEAVLFSAISFGANFAMSCFLEINYLNSILVITDCWRTISQIFTNSTWWKIIYPLFWL